MATKDTDLREQESHVAALAAQALKRLTSNLPADSDLRLTLELSAARYQLAAVTNGTLRVVPTGEED